MSTNHGKQDKHFPLSVHGNPIRRLFSSPSEFCSYVNRGQVVADLGCGPGYYTIALAESVGSEGKIYAVDSDEKAVRAVQNKANKQGLHNIEVHTSSASNLSFIKKESVNFILANGLLCSMAPQQHESTVSEMLRILKPTGSAYISAAKGFYSYVSRTEWERILEQFKVNQRGGDGLFAMADRWALVSQRQG
jgi:ubiquinone/menaquinone biosynthesis C-methylase UbiE